MDYEAWYSIYPRKQAKAQGFVMWSRLTAEEQTLAMDALPKHIRMWQAEGRTTKMIPLPASWLNPVQGRRWEDELNETLVVAAKTCCKCKQDITGGYTKTDDGWMCNSCWGHRYDDIKKPNQQLRLA